MKEPGYNPSSRLLRLDPQGIRRRNVVKRDERAHPAPLRRRSPGNPGDGGRVPRSDETADVTLVCLFCREKTTIRVFRNRELPGTVFWECLECQLKEAKPASRPGPKPDR